jgi:hypothetical protein
MKLTNKSTFRVLENGSEELKIKLEIDDAKISELTKKSKIRCNIYAESENTRKEHNSLSELN